MKKSIFKTSLGWAGVAASDCGICGVVLPRKDRRAAEQELMSAARRPRRPDPDRVRSAGEKEELMLETAVRRLRQYFSGEEVLFDLPLDLRYHTPFQRAVWKTTSAIPFGETRSYGWIAGRIRKPKAARAVGRAMGANPVPILVPCHRVVTSTGGLGGFSGGTGLKKTLLEMERTKKRR